MSSEIKIGVSSCLLGEKVRYDGGHKLDRYLSEVLGRFFALVPVCPEVECGMPVPREPMRLEGEPESPRLITHHTRVDMTEEMLSFCNRKLVELEKEDLCGFIFKKNSPSCGLFRVRIYGEGGRVRSGSGLFAAAVVRRFPHLPVEEEGRLADPLLRENFLERVFGHRRWKDFLAERPDFGKLVEFHSRQKLLLMAHSTSLYRDMGTLVAHGKELRICELLQRYEELFMKALALHATVKKHTNVLMHIMGYFKKRLSALQKQELLEVIDQYHRQQVPLLVPVSLLKHYVNEYDQQYLKQQCYLFPHPAELMLRNHA